MEPLYLKYKDQGFEIAAFPCNQFANQEPGTNAEIKAFAQGKYNATYDLYSKINVNGPDAIPLYKWLKSKKAGPTGADISWNFTKFLIDRNGLVQYRYEPSTNPNRLEPDIIHLLAQQPTSSGNDTPKDKA